MTKMQKLLSMILFGALYVANVSATGCPTCGGNKAQAYQGDQDLGNEDQDQLGQYRMLAEDQKMGSTYDMMKRYPMAGAAGMQGMEGLQSGLGVNPIIRAQQGNDKLGRIALRWGGWGDDGRGWGDWRDGRDWGDYGRRGGWGGWGDYGRRGWGDWRDWRRGGGWGDYGRNFFNMVRQGDKLGQGRYANRGLRFNMDQFPQMNMIGQGGMMPFNMDQNMGQFDIMNQFPQIMDMGQDGMGQMDFGQNGMFRYRGLGGRRHHRRGRGGIARWGAFRRRHHRNRRDLDFFKMMRQPDIMRQADMMRQGGMMDQGQDANQGLQFNMMGQYPQMNMMGQDANIDQRGIGRGAWMRNQERKGFGAQNMKIDDSQNAKQDFKIVRDIKADKADKADKTTTSTIKF